MKDIFTIVFVHLILCTGTFSQVKVWDKLYLPQDLSGMSLPVSQTTDNSGNLFIAGYEWVGSRYSIITYKVSWRGEIEWIKKYAGKDSLDCQPRQISFDKDSNLVVLAYDITNETGMDIILLKYNREGDLLWQKSYSSEGHLSDNPKTFVTDNNSNIYVVEETVRSSTTQDVNIIKFSSGGEELWIRQYKSGWQENESTRRIFLRNDKIISIGMSDSTGILYLSYNINGDSVNTFRYNFVKDPHDKISDYTIDTDGNAYLVGSAYKSDAFQVYNWTVVKVFSNGKKDWEDTVYNSSWINLPVNLILLKNGNMLVIGNGFDYFAHFYSYYMKLIEIDNSGNIIQNKSLSNIFQSYKDKYYIDENNNISLIASNPASNTINIAQISSNYELNWEFPINNSAIYQYVSTTPLLISRLNDSNIYVTSRLGNEVANHTIISRITEQTNSDIKIATDSPLIGEIIYDSSAALRWDKLDSNYSYRVLISKDSLDFENQLVADEVTNGNYFDFKRQETGTKYYWKVLGFNQSALTQPSDIKFFIFNKPSSVEVPTNFVLEQNYPNPFNNRTTIQYSVPWSDNLSRVVIKIYNTLGQEVKTVLDENKSPGKYSVIVSDAEMSSGVYFYQLRTNNVTITKKMVLLK